MIKERCLFVGIGQAGNNLVSSILKVDKRFNGLFINTSYHDMEQLDNVTNMYAIPSARGCARDRKKAQSYAKAYYQTIVDKIINDYVMCDMVYFVFSTGGGTGSGISVPILRMLASNKNSKKHFGAIMITPSTRESAKAFSNTVECWNEIMLIDNLKSYYVLDNNKRDDKLEINTEFAILFNRFVSLPESNMHGVLDESEIERMMTAKGMTCLYDLGDEDSIECVLPEECKRSIFAEMQDNYYEYIGISSIDEIEIDDVHAVIGGSPKFDTFHGYNTTSNFVSITGANPPTTFIEMIKDTYETKMSTNKATKIENATVKMPTVAEVEKTKKQNTETVTEKKVDNKKSKPKTYEAMLDEIDMDEFWKEFGV